LYLARPGKQTDADAQAPCAKNRLTVVDAAWACIAIQGASLRY